MPDIEPFFIYDFRCVAAAFARWARCRTLMIPRVATRSAMLTLVMSQKHRAHARHEEHEEPRTASWPDSTGAGIVLGFTRLGVHYQRPGRAAKAQKMMMQHAAKLRSRNDLFAPSIKSYRKTFRQWLDGARSAPSLPSAPSRHDQRAESTSRKARPSAVPSPSC
jgi:hypothetical protein